MDDVRTQILYAAEHGVGGGDGQLPSSKNGAGHTGVIYMDLKNSPLFVIRRQNDDRKFGHGYHCTPRYFSGRAAGFLAGFPSNSSWSRKGFGYLGSGAKPVVGEIRRAVTRTINSELLR